MNIKFSAAVFAEPVAELAIAHSYLNLPQLLRRQPERQLVAPPLVLEPIDAAEGLSNGNVEDQVSEGEKGDGDPAMAALESWGLGLGDEDEGEEDEEEEEEFMEFFLLEVNGSFFLQGFLEMELDYGVDGLECCFFWD